MAAGRRHALTSLVSSRRGELAAARIALDRSREILGTIRLLPEADALYWLGRAERELAARSPVTLTVVGGAEEPVPRPVRSH